MLRPLCNLKPGHYFFLKPHLFPSPCLWFVFFFSPFDGFIWFGTLAESVLRYTSLDLERREQPPADGHALITHPEDVWVTWEGRGGVGVGGSFSPRQHHSIWWTSSPRTSHGKPPLGSSVFSISSTPPQPHTHTHTFTPPPQPRVVLGSQCSSSPLDSFCCTSGRPHCPHPDLYLIHAGLMIHGAAYFVLNFVPNKFEI